MSDEQKFDWENYGEGTGLVRIKVAGGHIYEGTDGHLCFVNEIDLKRYESHLRDAFKQGYKTGQLDAKMGHSEEFSE